MYDILKFKEILKENLDEYRLHHSYCVADEAVRLARLYGGDEQAAYLAGLLHDVTKNFTAEEHLKIFNEFGIILSDVEKASVQLWHSISGACYLKKILKIENEEIISAVRYHTTAKADMTLLELILFVADFTSADRSYPDIGIIREKSNSSLEEAAVYGLAYTISDLASRERAIHPDTIHAYNYFINKKGEV